MIAEPVESKTPTQHGPKSVNAWPGPSDDAELTATHTIPKLLEAAKAEGGAASFLVSGATMAMRGKANFACMAPHKAALRTYSQSLFDTYAKEGVHVAHVVIDGAFDSPGTNPFGKHITLMDPDELAGVYVGLHEQPKSVWSFEIQVGPSSGDMGMRL